MNTPNHQQNSYPSYGYPPCFYTVEPQFIMPVAQPVNIHVNNTTQLNFTMLNVPNLLDIGSLNLQPQETFWQNTYSAQNFCLNGTIPQIPQIQNQAKPGILRENTSAVQTTDKNEDSARSKISPDCHKEASFSGKPVSAVSQATEAEILPLQAWNTDCLIGEGSQKSLPSPSVSKNKNYLDSKIGVSDTKNISVKTTRKLTNLAGEVSEGNILKKMQRFYQAFYIKISKTLGKGKKSKKDILQKMCLSLRKSTLLSEIKIEDLVLHLGSVIYPSKAFLKNRASFSASMKEGMNEGEVRAKKSISDFHGALLDYSQEKLEQLLSQETFEKLYIVFRENLNNSLKGKNEVLA